MLKCWDSICTPKSCWGLGFRRLQDFNKALFSKLAWLIASDKDLLWIQLLKSNDLSVSNSSWICNNLKTLDI